MKLFVKIIILSALFTASCAGIDKSDRGPYPDKPFRIWAHSDIQPKKPEHYTNFETAVKDMTALGPVEIAVTGGDLVEKKNVVYHYRNYLEKRKLIDTKAWFEIAGNHEWKQIGLYRKHINKNLFYSVKAGNMLLLFISNAEKGHLFSTPPYVVKWWAKKVAENQDKIIITFAHATLKGSGLIQSRLGIKRLYFQNSEDFEKVMKKYRVDLWVSGHSHLPGYLPWTDNRNEKLNGTVFIDTGAVRTDFMTGIESRILCFYRGSDLMVIKHRDHGKKKFVQSRQRTYRLSKKFTIGKNSAIEIEEILPERIRVETGR